MTSARLSQVVLMHVGDFVGKLDGVCCGVEGPPRQRTEVSPRHLRKASQPSRFKVFGSVRELRLRQLRKALGPTLVNVFFWGNVMEVSLLQFLNASVPILSKLVGSVRERSPRQFSNTFELILVTPWGMATSSTSLRSQRNPVTLHFSIFNSEHFFFCG